MNLLGFTISFVYLTFILFYNAEKNLRIFTLYFTLTILNFGDETDFYNLEEFESFVESEYELTRLTNKCTENEMI